MIGKHKECTLIISIWDGQQVDAFDQVETCQEIKILDSNLHD